MLNLSSHSNPSNISYKYVYKGGDRATVEFSKKKNEVSCYLDARYITASEVCWRLFEFNMHAQKPPVVKLQVHLPGQQPVFFNPQHNFDLTGLLAQVQMGARDTALTAFFKANQIFPHLALPLLYHEFPKKFVWKPSSREWKPRQRGFAIGCMYYVPPTAGEKFYMCLLLTSVHGPSSYDDLRTYRGVTANTFKEACQARGLLAHDQEWSTCIQDASAMQTGHQLRMLFATILLDCAPVNPSALWLQFKDNLCDDLCHSLQHMLNPIPEPTDAQIWDYGLFLIDKIMQHNHKSLADIPSMPTSVIAWEEIRGNPLLAQQLNYDRQDQQCNAQQLCQQFNAQQASSFQEILAAIRDSSGQCFFLQGAGGCGKTFVYRAISHHLRAEGKVVICVASSGIAATLLDGGTTAHYRFKIPIKLHEQSSCAISRRCQEAELLRNTYLIIWDEALMLHRHAFEAVDHCLRDIRAVDRLFGGITVVLGGDYQQILPVILRGSQADIVSASLFNSSIWPQLKTLQLLVNMRIGHNMEEALFAQWLLD